MDKDFFKKIESGEIKMTSKYYFIIRDILVVLAAVVILLVSVFFISLVFFELQESGATTLTRFGSGGVQLFFAIFPWIPILIALALTFLLSLVLKRFSFAYRKPLLYVPVGVAAVILVLSGLAGIGRIHNHLRDLSSNGGPEFIGAFYHNNSNIGHDRITVGEVVSENPQTIIMKNDDEQYTVTLSAQTQFPFGDNFQNNERIAVIGVRSGNNIQAIAIRRLLQESHEEPGFFLFRP